MDRPATSLERIRLLEALAAHAWPGATVETLAGWRLSMDRGVTRRANSVIANALAHDADPPRLIDQVERRYRARGLSPCFKLCGATEPPDLRRRLQERGYREEGFSHVLTGAPGACATPPAEGVGISRSLDPDAVWLGACWPSVAADALAAQHAIVARIGLPRTFVLATVDGKPAGAGSVSASAVMPVSPRSTRCRIIAGAASPARSSPRSRAGRRSTAPIFCTCRSRRTISPPGGCTRHKVFATTTTTTTPASPEPLACRGRSLTSAHDQRRP